MNLQQVTNYLENVQDLTTAKVILESLSDPTGYYFGIYSKLSKGISNGSEEKKIRKIINKYYDEKLIDHYEYMKAISFDADEVSIFNKLRRREKFANALSKIKSKDELIRYLNILVNKLKDKNIDFDTYVPRYVLKRR